MDIAPYAIAFREEPRHHISRTIGATRYNGRYPRNDFPEKPLLRGIHRYRKFVSRAHE
jgi:hypothetical protein